MPEGHYFMMGDNRDNSADSRANVGYVPFENFVGKAEIIFFSTNGSARIWEVWKWPLAIRYDRIGAAGRSEDDVASLELEAIAPIQESRAASDARFRMRASAQQSNERLEFLGDRVLGLIVAERLYGELSVRNRGQVDASGCTRMVSREACAKAAEAAGLAPHLIMAPAESKSGGRNNSAILADACEAVIAASISGRRARSCEGVRAALLG